MIAKRYTNGNSKRKKTIALKKKTIVMFTFGKAFFSFLNLDNLIFSILGLDHSSQILII